MVRGPVIYLVATCWKYEDVRQFALHRFPNPKIMEKSATRVKGFELDAYIAAGEFQFPLGPPIRLQALFDRGAAAHLYETPLSQDQLIEDVSPEQVRVSATVPDSQQLEWRLLGFADGVVVEGPQELTARMRERARKFNQHYQRKE